MRSQRITPLRNLCVPCALAVKKAGSRTKSFNKDNSLYNHTTEFRSIIKEITGLRMQTVEVLDIDGITGGFNFSVMLE